MSAPVFNYETIKQLAKERGCSVRDLLALSKHNDPFFAGMPRNAAAAEWFAALWERFDLPRGAHLRRIHYRLISQDPPVAMRDGKLYRNTEGCWAELGMAAKTARYLNLVPLDAFQDRRAPEPTIYMANDKESASLWVLEGDLTHATFVHEFPDLPRYLMSPPSPEQRYHVEVWIEKSTMDDVLLPACRKHGANLITGVGELSLTAVVRLIERAATSRKPVRVLYISDHDPAGRSMPCAVARKAEYLLRHDHPDIDMRLYPIALTPEQVRHFKLPRTPIKETELRRSGFEDRYGEGATELDALEATRPGELRRLVDEEIGRYRDRDLELRIADAAGPFRKRVREIEAEVTNRHKDAIDALRADHEAIRKEMHDRLCAWEQRAESVWKHIRADLFKAKPDINAIAFPEAEVADERDGALFDSRRDYLEQLEHYHRFQGKGVRP